MATEFLKRIVEFCVSAPDKVEPVARLLEELDGPMVEAGFELVGRFSRDELPRLLTVLECLRKAGARKHRVERLLTPQERRVLLYIGRGMTSLEIAGRLKVKKFTVNKHRENIRRKLEIRTTGEMVLLGRDLLDGESSNLKFARDLTEAERGALLILTRGGDVSEIARKLGVGADEARRILAEIDFKLDIPGISEFLIFFAGR